MVCHRLNSYFYMFIFLLQVPAQYGAVRMISQGQGNLLLVGTVRNCILQSTVDFNFSPVVQVGDRIYSWVKVFRINP